MSDQVDSRRLGYYVFIFILAVLFAMQWGPGARGCDKAGRIVDAEVAATVNGKDIPLREFAQAYGSRLQMLRQQGLPAEMARQFGLDKQVMDELVNRELLAQAAEARGLTASDDDLRDQLKKIPEFQKDGQFDFERYQEIIRNYEGTTEVAFEAKLRRQLASQRLLQLVEAGVVVSDDEVKARYLKDGSTAKATFVRFAPTMFSDKVPPMKQADIDAWANAHGKEIVDNYEANKISYFVPEKAKVRQILLRVPRDATQAQKDDARQKLENVRKQIVDEKKSFAELAKAVSEDTETREKGGDLGYVDRLALPGEFADRVFALKPGEVSMVTESPIGFHLGTLEDKKAQEQKPLDSVKGLIAAQLAIREKAKDLAKAEAEKALAELKKGKKLADLFPAEEKKEGQSAFAFQAETKPQAKETGEFASSAETVPQLGAAPEVHKAIFARTEPGLIEQPVAVGDSLVLVMVDERHAASDADYATKQSQLKLEALKAKQFELRESFVKSLKQGGTVNVHDASLAKVVGEG